MANYYLIAVSNYENLEKCMRFSTAGFPSSNNGAWTYSEIERGDFVSFLYGAHIFNLYCVVDKMAFRNATIIPPWKPLKFPSGRTYSFPFRLSLQKVKTIRESIVKPEFTYIAENLLKRGGYRRTHFQADTTTLHVVSNFQEVNNNIFSEKLKINEKTFIPKFTTSKELTKKEDTFKLNEQIIQVLIKKKLKAEWLDKIINKLEIDLASKDLEILGEKALSEGFVDIFIKEKHPEGKSHNIIIEVKTKEARKSAENQLLKYVKEFGDENKGAVLIAPEFSKKIQGVTKIKYGFKCSTDKPHTLDQLLQKFYLEFY